MKARRSRCLAGPPGFSNAAFNGTPRTKHDALIRAARIYDHKLKETGLAIDFYKGSSKPRLTRPRKMKPESASMS